MLCAFETDCRKGARGTDNVASSLQTFQAFVLDPGTKAGLERGVDVLRNGAKHPYHWCLSLFLRDSLFGFGAMEVALGVAVMAESLGLPVTVIGSFTCLGKSLKYG